VKSIYGIGYDYHGDDVGDDGDDNGLRSIWLMLKMNSMSFETLGLH